MIDREIQDRLRLQYNPEGSTLRYAQLRMLEMLKFIDGMCYKYNLSYWIDSGTLLGAARHGGFIPWDDDLDISMPIEDALKLQDIMKNSIFDGHIFLQTPKTEKYYVHSSWVTLRDTKSEYISESNYNEYAHKGLQVDIFMVSRGQPFFIRKIFAYLNINIVLKPLLYFKNKFMHSIAFLNFKILDRMATIARKFIKKGNHYSRSIGCIFYKPQFSPDTIFPLKKIIFEGLEFNCPNNVCKYLSTIYGDWEKIPPDNAIKTHNVKINISSLISE